MRASGHARLGGEQRGPGGRLSHPRSGVSGGPPRSAGHRAPRVPAGDQRVRARDPGEQGARGAGRAAAPGAAGRPRRPALPHLVRRAPPPQRSASQVQRAALRRRAFTTVYTLRTAGPAAARRDWGMQEGDRLVVTGSLPQLGNWQPRQPLAMAEVATPHWEAEARCPACPAHDMRVWGHALYLLAAGVGRARGCAGRQCVAVTRDYPGRGVRGQPGLGCLPDGGPGGERPQAASVPARCVRGPR